jgi:hypothetical protein
MTGWTVGMDWRRPRRGKRRKWREGQRLRRERNKVSFTAQRSKERRTHRIRIPHHSPRNHPSLDHHLRSYSKERRIPQDEVGEFTRFDVADDVRDAVGDGGVDGVFGDVALRFLVRK